MVKLPCRTAWSCTSAFVLVLAALIWVGAPWMSEPSRKTPPSADHQPRISEAYGRIPLHFEANHGQTDDRVKFVTRGRGYTMFLTANEAVLALSRPEAREVRDQRSKLRGPDPSRKVERHVLRMTFTGASPNPRVVGQEELPGKANYFIGNDPAKWRTNVPTYARVHYQDIYPGVDLVYYGNQRVLEYDFIVRPGADPARIGLSFEGADTIEIDAQGDLLLHATHGAIRQRTPIIYQEVDGVRREIAGGYVLAQNDTVSFHVGAYDASRPLVIDPALFYSTYLGGTGDEEGGPGIAVDAAGNAYVTGSTTSIDFPITPGSFQGSIPGFGADAFVVKLNSTGSALVYSTYLGGSATEDGLGLAIDDLENAYIVGVTVSNDFPTTPGAFKGQCDDVGGDGFITKLNAGGSALLYSTCLGGASIDQTRTVAVDAMGNAYVSGLTNGADFPTTPGAFDNALGGTVDAFVTKLNPLGTGLLYSTYLGGSGRDVSGDIAVDATDSAYVTGSTDSSDYPTTLGAHDTTLGGSRDAFITKLSPTGTGLVYSTYLGGTSSDAAGSVALDTAGNAYVTGSTSGDFPTTSGSFQALFGGGLSDAFIAKLNALGSGLIYASYLGGAAGDSGAAVAVDLDGNVYVTGITESMNFPVTLNAFQSTSGGGQEAFVAKASPDGSVLVYSSYLGGTGDDLPADIAVDVSPGLEPNAYVVGQTESTNFPTTEDAFQVTHNGLRDAFVAQIIDVVLPPGPTTGRVTGHGTIEAGKFHLIAQQQTDGTVSGKVQYRSQATGAKVKSETITLLLITGNMARIDGTCTIDSVPCTFRVDVTDVDDTGTNDTFTISVSPGPTEGGTLQKGDIQIQQ